MTGLRILGAVLAGGQSRRFGSDKAIAMIAERPMIDHVIEALKPQVERVIICGRTWPGVECIKDLRGDRLGPLAGLEAAFQYAADRGFDGIITVPVDTLPLPPNLEELLAGIVPKVLALQRLIGYWPTNHQSALIQHIDDGARSIFSWVVRSGALLVHEPIEMSNVNRTEDLEALQRTYKDEFRFKAV